MQIIELMYILFKSDASDVKKGTKEAKKSVDDLNTALKNTNKSSNQVGDSLLKMGHALTGLVAGFVSAAAIINGFKAAVAYETELDQVSRSLGVNIELLDAWGSAVQRAGGSTTGFQHSLQTLATNLNTTTEDALRILPILADAFQNLGETRALHYGTMLGLDQSTILLLQQGRRELDAFIQRQKELGLVTKQDAEIARKFNYAWQDTTHALRTSFIAAGSVVLPILTQLLDGFTKVVTYLTSHSDLVVAALIPIIGAVGALALEFLFINASMIAWVAVIGAAAAALALLYEDIQMYFRGMDSLIGRVLPKWDRLAEVIEKVGNFLKSLNSGFDGADKLFEPKKNIEALQKAQEALTLASTNPITSQTSNSIIQNNSKANNQNSLTIGQITINTQASTPDGIAEAVQKELRDQLWQANSNFDDGVAA